MIIKKQKLIDIYFTASIILFTGAILTLGGELWGTESLEGDPIQRSVYFVIFIFMIPLLIINYKIIYQLMINEKIISIILIISIFSILWSGLPLVTIRRVVALTLTTLFGVLFAHYYKLEGQINILAYSFGIIVILCFLYPILFPEIGIHQLGSHEGRWRGVFVQKNSMASILVLSLLVFFYKIFSKKDTYTVYIIMIFISLSLIVLSWSTTAILSLIIIFISLLVFVFYTKLNKKNTILNIILLLIIVVPSGIYLFNNISDVFNYFGKDATLTGRLPLWYFISDFIMDRPFLGYGFGSFWHGSESPSAAVVRKFTWVPKDAHNGYIDIVLNIGMFGLILIILKIIDIFTNTKKLYRTRKKKKYLLVISIIVYILLINITSSSILVQNSIFWILFVSISIGINKDYRGKKFK